jgi:hypothetical protein
MQFELRFYSVESKRDLVIPSATKSRFGHLENEGRRKELICSDSKIF